MIKWIKLERDNGNFDGPIDPIGHTSDTMLLGYFNENNSCVGIGWLFVSPEGTFPRKWNVSGHNWVPTHYADIGIDASKNTLDKDNTA